MNLLLDANLSWRLTKPLLQHYTKVIHAGELDYPQPVKDIEIWTFAQQNHFTVVTNDEDFQNLLMLKGFPPKIILLRVGNQSSQFILQLLVNQFSKIEKLDNSTDIGLLELY